MSQPQDETYLILKQEIEDLKTVIKSLEDKVQSLNTMIDELKTHPAVRPQNMTNTTDSNPAATQDLANAQSPNPVTQPDALPSDQASDEMNFENIPITAQLISELGFRAVVEKHFTQADVIKANLENIIKERLKATQHLLKTGETENLGPTKNFMTGYSKSHRNPQVIHDKKIKILNDIQVNLNIMTQSLDNPGLNSTFLLDLLDEFIKIDDELFQVNSSAQTPTKQGPIVFLIRDINEDTLEFLKNVVLRNQTNPANSR